MKIIFLGATKFSEEILKALYDNGIPVSTIFTIPQEFTISYSAEKVKNYNYSDLDTIAKKHNTQVYYVNSAEKKITDYEEIIRDLQPDVILVMGWYYMLPKQIRSLAKLGAWGLHASMLPKYAGGAPLVWAIIKGETTTGVTLFKLDDGVDDGDIIAQREISIDENDSIKEVYSKATEASKEIVITSLKNIHSIKYVPQNKDLIEVYPQRSPADGEIDLKANARDIYNFIRAQSHPYPGAFIRTSDGKKLIIEKARIE